MKFPLSNSKPTAWALFLGCSWTWCIGMFLPVLLVRDLGVWGWVVFAVPNVVGAAAMGWVLNKPGQSGRMTAGHRTACACFSAVTIAFHVFFVLWFVPRLVGLPPAALVFALAAVYLLLTVSRAGWDLPAAAVVWAVSLAMLGLYVSRFGGPAIPATGRLGSAGLLWLTPVCVFGFALCPYLDLTFHRARRSVDAAGAKFAFGAGFGVCFLAMIVFTLLYATALAPLVADGWRERLRPAFGAIIATHLIVQSAYTLAVHTRSLVAEESRRGELLLLAVLAQVGLFLGLAAWVLPRYHGFDAGELIYRLFMSFYGLLFPAYVWHCMIPGRDGTVGVTRSRLRGMLLGVAAAAPMYWMGFVENQLVWLVPGLAVVLLSRFVVPSRSAVLAGSGR